MESIGLAQGDQLDYLMSVQRVTTPHVADVLAKLWDDSLRRPERPSESRPSTGVVAQLKEKVDIAALVAQYVELDERGRGPCPWHGPDRRPGFVVNADDGYLFDFHDGTGGDVVEFYRRIEGLSPKDAIKRLARRFL